MNSSRLCALVLAACLLSSRATASEPATGWRGNGTGLWPDAHPPLEWYRIPHGAMEGLRAAAERPSSPEAGDAPLVEKGLVREWLILGPFPVADAVEDFDIDPLGGEAQVKPTTGDRTAERVWQPFTVRADDPLDFGQADLPWVDLAKIVGFQRNQLAYAHTYLYSPFGGPARIVVDHGQGLKAWLNGQEVYRQPQRAMSLGSYVAPSAHELNYLYQRSPLIELDLTPGWNRLLLKLSTSRIEDFTDMRCCLRIMDPPDVLYESKNIAWMTELPGRSTSTPIIVRDRLFLMAEPDELVCLDKRTGRILWSAANNYYEALTPAEHEANPAYAQRVDPLVALLREEMGIERRLELRRAIRQALLEIDAPRFQLHGNDHFEAHLGIVGFTMPTPVSDGEHVFVWLSTGVAACYDLAGNRQWIVRLDANHLGYGSSPGLSDGVLGVFLEELNGLDSRTGELRWTQNRVHQNLGAVLATRLAGQDVFVSQLGEVIRPADGELLFRPRDGTRNESGWAPPVILGDVMYLPNFGVKQLSVFDFSKVQADDWDPELKGTINTPDDVNHLPSGAWLDRPTAGSPLVWQGRAYLADIYGTLFVMDLGAQRTLAYQQLGLAGLMHYNAVPVAASPTLVGDHLLVLDNQGTTLVLEPGPEFKVVATNRIGTQLDRWWPVPGQETLAYAPPIVDGDRLYLRGERYLYCIGRDE